MSEVENPVFAYLYDDVGRVVTLAYTVFQDEVLGEVNNPYTAYVGYAICRPDDQHCKVQGRRIAEGRMSKLDSRMEIPVGHDTRRQKRLEAIVQFLGKEENTLDQYGGRLLSNTAFEHSRWRDPGRMGNWRVFDLETHRPFDELQVITEWDGASKTEVSG